MDPRIGSIWLLATCVGIVMISCYISGVACDVPDDVVYTDLHKAVRIGDRVVLKCQFRGTPLTVYWKKGDDPERSPTLVSWITGDPVTGLCESERLCQIMEMNAEFSLIIKEVSIVEQGLYVCRVANYKDLQIHNFTDISVFSPPKEPYPIINECQMISPNDTETTCTISTNQSVEISCSASGYYPDIDLYFLHGSTSLHTKDTIEVTNLDGTKNKTIYVNATASEISYVCFVSIPGLQEQRTATVLVNLRTSSSPMPTGSTTSIGTRVGYLIMFNISLLVVILSSIKLGRLWEGRRIQGTRKGEVGEKELELVAMPKDNETIPTEGIQEANTSVEGKGGSQNSEDKKSSRKEATDTNNVVAEISIEENPSTKEEVMQEKSGDGAAESKENTAENVDTMEQDGSDECGRDESFKLLIQART